MSPKRSRSNASSERRSCRTFRKIIEKFLIFPLTQPRRTRSYNNSNRGNWQQQQQHHRCCSNNSDVACWCQLQWLFLLLLLLLLAMRTYSCTSAPTTAILFMTSTMASRKGRSGRGAGGVAGEFGSCCSCNFMCILGIRLLHCVLESRDPCKTEVSPSAETSACVFLNLCRLPCMAAQVILIRHYSIILKAHSRTLKSLHIFQVKYHSNYDPAKSKRTHFELNATTFSHPRTFGIPEAARHRHFRSLKNGAQLCLPFLRFL